MGHLEALKERLKYKPDVQPMEGVRVILAPPLQEDKEKAPTEKRGMPIITIEKDDGKRAQQILEKIKKNKISNVIKKLPEEGKQPIIMQEPQAPVEKPKPMQKIKKLKKSFIIEEEEDDMPEELPEGGPRLEEVRAEEEVKGKEEEAKGEEEEVKGKEEEAKAIEAPRKRDRLVPKITKDIVPLGTNMMIKIGDTPLPKRLPALPVFNNKVSSYYMNNREIFVNFINGLFEPYKEELMDETKGITCEDIGKDSGKISLLTHQKIVRDYINLYTPYRGLLLFHGLGSGKTCTSIAIAEGMKSSKKIYIMTPASLRQNYIDEIKK